MSTSMARTPDAQLVERAAGGDSAAVAAIYDRYADSIYSFCRSRLRNEADAADATQDTFVRAATRLRQLRDPTKLRPWLYAIARNQIVSTGRATSRTAAVEQMDHLPSTDDDPDVDLIRVEAANQLWDAAGGLKERDQEVLELHLRHGLVGQDLAAALGVPETRASVMLSRMRDRIGVALGGLLVARHGRQDCPQLDQLLTNWDGRFTLDVRSRVNRHVRSCEICERTRATALASGISFGVLPIAPAPAFLRERIVDSMTAATTAPAAGSPESSRWVRTPAARPAADGWQWRDDGFPKTWESGSDRWGLILLSAAALVLPVLIVATIFALTDSGSEVITEVGGITETTASQTSTSSTSSTTSSTASSQSSLGVVAAPATGTTDDTTTTSATTQAPTSTAAETTVAPATTAGPSTTAGPTTTVRPTTTARPTTTQRPTTATPLTTTTETATTVTTTTVPETTSSVTTESIPDTTDPPNEPPMILLALVRPAQVRVSQGSCQGETALVSVEATDPDGTIESVTAQWQADGSTPLSTPLVPFRGGPLYRGTVGPWLVDGPQKIEVVAADDRNSVIRTSLTINVVGCPAG